MNTNIFSLFLKKLLTKNLCSLIIKMQSETMFAQGGNMKRVNKVKFIRSTIMTIGLVIFIILLLTNISFSHTEIIYKEIAISSGDTLWNIAKYEKNNNAYFEDKDVRDIIAEIKYINNLNSSNLSIGDKLHIPTIIK